MDFREREREREERREALIEINSVRKPKTSVCTYVLRLPVECVKIAANDGNQMPGSSKNVELWNAAGKNIRIGIGGEPSHETWGT